MSASTISSKYQIVIPKRIRQHLNLKRGQKVQMIEFLDRVEIIPLYNIEDMMGFLEGMDTEVQRDEEDRV